MIATAGLAMVLQNQRNPWGWYLLNITWLNISMILALVPHEFAHAWTARLLGMRVFRIVLGSGRTWWRGPVLGFDVEAKTFPLNGAVTAAHPTPDHARGKAFLYILAGPLANALLLLATLALCDPRRWHIETFVETLAWAQIFAVANLLLVVVNLWPHQIQTSFGPRQSDGRQLFQNIFKWNKNAARERHAAWFFMESQTSLEQQRLEEARTWVDHGLAVYPDSFLLRQHLTILLIITGDLQAARDFTLPLLAEQKDGSPVHLILKNNIAYIDALLEDPSLLEEADRYSTEALAAFPWVAALKNTRGVVLLALDRPAEALPLLRESANEPGKAPTSLAQSLCTLAITEARLGDGAAAEKSLQRARQAMANCFLLPRAEAAIQAAQSRVVPPPGPTGSS